jgi:hypothetical protein
LGKRRRHQFSVNPLALLVAVRDISNWRGDRCEWRRYFWPEWIKPMTDEILTFLRSALILFGGVAVVALAIVSATYGIFRLFSEKWLNSKFEERLAAYKHEQQKELEQLKFDINTLMDRTVKLHQREFDVLPEAWGRVNDAFNYMQPLGLGFQQYPDLNRMSEARLNSFLDQCDLEDWQKSEIRLRDDMTKYYQEAIMPIRLWQADEKRVYFSNYFSKNGIFIPPEIKSKFETINTLLFEASVERRLSLQHPDFQQMYDKGMILYKEGPPLLKSLEADVQARLWNSPLSKPA